MKKNIEAIIQNYERLFDDLKDNDRFDEALIIGFRLLELKTTYFGHTHESISYTLDGVATICLAKGEYGKAESLFTGALQILKNCFGDTHPDVAIVMGKIALIYQNTGEYEKAEFYYKRSLEIRLSLFDSEHPLVLSALNNLATLYLTIGNYKNAELFFKKVLEIKEKISGSEHPDIAIILNNLAAIYNMIGDYTEAEIHHKKSLGITLKIFGSEHPEVATGFNNLAYFYHTTGNYAEAKTLYKRSLEIREKIFGTDHPDVASVLNNLANLYATVGKYEKAEFLFKIALEKREKILGSEHPDIANSLNGLANLYDNIGNYADAESLWKKALKIREKILGSDHPEVATILNNLASIYNTVGNYTDAESLLKRTLGIYEKIFGNKHPNVAIVLSNLGTINTTMGNYSKAKSFFKRSLRVREEMYGSEHPDMPRCLLNIACLYFAEENYQKADSVFKKALEISEKVLGVDHPDVAGVLNNLANNHIELGEVSQAGNLYKRALKILEKGFGSEHPNLIMVLSNLALFFSNRNDYEIAYKYLIDSHYIEEKLIDQILGFTSENQKMNFFSKIEIFTQIFLSLISQCLNHNHSVKKEAMTYWLRRKGIILEAQKRYQETMLYSDDPEAVQTFQELSRVASRLSNLTFAGPGEAPEIYKQNLNILRERKEELQKKLSRISHDYAFKQKIAKADCEKVAQKLPNGTALIEFAKIHMYNFKEKNEKRCWKPSHYLAFILPSGNGDNVTLIDLGDAETIDNAIATYKSAIGSKNKEMTGPAKKAHDLIFAPLKKELDGVNELFISPDGNLNLIPFEILMGPNKRYLIEDYTLNYLASGREIIGFGELKEKSGKSLLMGDPDYDMGETERNALLKQFTLHREDTDKASGRSLDMIEVSFKRLRWTKEEVTAIHDLLGKENSEVYTDKNALEEILMQKKAPRFLHLATHGFFLKDTEIELPGHSRGIIMQDAIPMFQRPGKKIHVENPLLRSGIALAGANTALKSDDTENASGLVTAEKILGLNLHGTEMVVLSACETGLGEIRNGEGVFGLRRAFSQAGAKSLVMSMWPVPDEETKELMLEFYKNITAKNMNRCQALRQAMLKQMKTVKQRYGHSHPLYWGGFVFAGEP